MWAETHVEQIYTYIYLIICKTKLFASCLQRGLALRAEVWSPTVAILTILAGTIARKGQSEYFNHGSGAMISRLGQISTSLGIYLWPMLVHCWQLAVQCKSSKVLDTSSTLLGLPSTLMLPPMIYFKLHSCVSFSVNAFVFDYCMANWFGWTLTASLHNTFFPSIGRQKLWTYAKDPYWWPGEAMSSETASKGHDKLP